MTDSSEKGPSARRRSWVAKVDIAMHVGFLLTVVIALAFSLITGRR